MRFIIVAVSVLCAIGSANEVGVWQSRSDGGVLLFENLQWEQTNLAQAGDTFILLSLAGVGSTTEPGWPQLPVLRSVIEIPFGAELELRPAFEELQEFSLEHRIYPVQPSFPKSGPAPGFVMEEKAYQADQTYSLGSRVVEIGIMRGHRLALIETYPVAYNPATGVVQTAGRVRVEVFWSGVDWATTRAQQERYDSRPYWERLQGVCVNWGQLQLVPPPDLPVGYLIIVPDAWAPNIAPLAEWRRRKGFHVFLRKLSEVGGGTATAVKNYIQNAYDNWPIPPSFVLLVGDVDRIGYFTGSGTGQPPTDLNFSLLAGNDYFPDLDLSRASVANAAQLDSLVAKIISYEQNTWIADRDWLNRAYFIASADGAYHQVAERTHQYVMAKFRSRGVVCDSLWLYYRQGTDINTAVNSGRAWVTYSGHGDVNCWADPSPKFTITEVRALSNLDKVPYVQTYACLSGNYTSTSYPECFSESWIRAGRRGGIAHIASTVTSYWTEDDTLERRVFDCMLDSSFFWVMGGFNKAKLIYYRQMGASGMTRRYFEMYNMMGDGAIDVYSSRPESLYVSHPSVVPLGSSHMFVSVQSAAGPVRNALVCITARTDTTVFVSGYTDGAGQVFFNLNLLIPDTLYVTVSGHNLATYRGVALAIPMSGAYVVWCRAEPDDSLGGNNDRIINPGETINLKLWLKNWGQARAEGIEARLRTTDPNLVLLDSIKYFDDIPAGDSVYSGPDGFDFVVANSCTNGYRLLFTVNVRDYRDSTWQSLLALPVGAPALIYSGCETYDRLPGGNGNRMLDPGEEADLIITLRNAGKGKAYEVSGILRSGDARLTVLDSLCFFGTIPEETTGNNNADRVRVSAALSIPRQTMITCTLLVSYGDEMRVFPLDLPVGFLRQIDPIPDGPRTPALYYAYDAIDTLYDEAPVYAWLDIRGTGTRLSLADDQTVTLSLPAGFGYWRYYGVSYDRISICSNGWVAPGSTSYTAYSNTALPNASAPPMVCASWDDYDPRYGGGVWWYYDQPNGRLIVQYDSVEYVGSANWDRFQVIIYDTSQTAPSGDNVVVVQYASANNYISNTVGLQDPTRTIAIQCLYNGTRHQAAAPLVPRMAIKYTTALPTGLAEQNAHVGVLRRLLLASPNPFRTRTTISLSTLNADGCELRIYDAGGRLIRTFAKSSKSELLWDGCDESGRRCGRGVYICRTEAGSGSVTLKLVMLGGRE